MRRLAFALFASAPLISGCHIATNASRNLINEPRQYFDGVHVEKHLRKEGRAAFHEVQRQFPNRCFSEDFECGFVEGYADYLDNGGNASVPAVPPLKYRHHRYYNPEGHARIRDWFLGFKYGMDVAIATGCRPFYTTPILLPEKPEMPPLDITVLPTPPVTMAPPKDSEKLPTPREIPGTDKTQPSPAIPLPPGTDVKPPAPGTGGVEPPRGPGTIPVPAGVVPPPVIPKKPDEKPPGGKVSQGETTKPAIVPVGFDRLIPDLPEPPAHGPIFDLPPPKPALR
jgi:hypothetical protein